MARSAPSPKPSTGIPGLKIGADVAAEDQELLQKEANAFTNKGCITDTMSSIIGTASPETQDAAQTLEELQALAQQYGTEIIRSESTDDTMRTHSGFEGTEYFGFGSITSSREGKLLGCTLE